MFDPARALTPVFAMFGKDAGYRRAGGAELTACRIIVNAADDHGNLGLTNLVGAKRAVEVRKAELPERPVKGARFEPPDSGAPPLAETLVIVATPAADDPDALVWTCLCDPC